MDVISILYVVYLVQATGTMSLALLFAGYYRLYRRPYLRDWAWSWAALCVYVLCALAAVLWSGQYPAAHPWRLFLTSLTLVAGYSQVGWLLAGTFAVARGREVERRWRRLAWVLVLFGSIALALPFTGDDGMAAARFFTRIGVRSGVAGLAYLGAAIWLARGGGWRRGFGRAIVIGAFALYGAEQLNYFLAVGLDGLGIREMRADFSLFGFVDFMLQLAMGFGMLIWLLEDDRDELKRTAEALRHSEERLQRAQRLEAVGQLAGGVAHDFNNLLTVISGRGQRLMRRMEEGTEDWQEVRQIDEAADRGAALVRQLLAFSRRQVLAPQQVDLNAIVDDVVSMMGRSVGEQIEVVCDLEPDLGWVSVDPAQLEQALVNLILNARDAMPEGGRLAIETRNVDVVGGDAESISGLTSGAHVELVVHDSGVGIDDKTKQHVFEPFFTTKEFGKGSGLGLATVYGVVRQSGGAIRIESEVGQGTVARIHLPRAATPATPPTLATDLPSVPSENVPVQAQGATILVVEDEERIRGLLSAVLEDNGYEVIVASGGAEAIEAVVDRDIQLLLTDVVMPGMDGAELADCLEATRPGLQVLFMSGYSEEIVSSRFANGRRKLLEKPFSLTDLLDRVRAATEV